MRDRSLKIVLVPDDSESRSYEIAYRRLRLLRGLAIGLAVLLTFVVTTWGYMAARVAHVVELEAQVAALQAERARFPALIRHINDLEAQYESLRALFAPEGAGATSELCRSSERDDRGSDMPDSWPLTERGFVTQGLLDDAGQAHPGLDIAIPTGSYIRAAGAGQVLEVGDDPTYGLYVRIGHGNGYETLYAHASVTAVRLGEDIRRNEVIAFSGSTGRSTAPHLHFEVLLERAAVDPLKLVQQP